MFKDMGRNDKHQIQNGFFLVENGIRQSVQGISTPLLLFLSWEVSLWIIIVSFLTHFCLAEMFCKDLKVKERFSNLLKVTELLKRRQSWVLPPSLLPLEAAGSSLPYASVSRTCWSLLGETVCLGVKGFTRNLSVTLHHRVVVEWRGRNQVSLCFMVKKPRPLRRMIKGAHTSPCPCFCCCCCYTVGWDVIKKKNKK